MGAGREQQRGAVYYEFQDSGGRLHIVDSIESVPQAMRPGAQRLAYGEHAATVVSSGSARLSGWPTFALGFGAALICVLLFNRLPGTMRIVLRLVIVGGIACLLGGAYLGFARHATGQGSGALASPQQIIEDAKQAVAKMNARQQADQAELKEIEQAK